MELEKMGFSLTLIVITVLGNFILVAIGASLVAYFGRLIKRWKEEEAVHQLHSTGSDNHDYSSARRRPKSHRGRQESNQPELPLPCPNYSGSTSVETVP